MRMTTVAILMLVVACGDRGKPSPSLPIPDPATAPLKLTWVAYRVAQVGEEAPPGTHHSRRIGLDDERVEVYHFAGYCDYEMTLTPDERFVLVARYRDGKEPAERRIGGEWYRAGEKRWVLDPDAGPDVIESGYYGREGDGEPAIQPVVSWCGGTLPVLPQDVRPEEVLPKHFFYAPGIDRETGQLGSPMWVEDPRDPRSPAE